MAYLKTYYKEYFITTLLNMNIGSIDKTNDYLQISFESKEKYGQYLNKSLERSIKDFKSSPTTDDKILTISTCYIDSDHRLVVQAKLIGSE